jgi:hypothetical protein
MHLNVTEDFMLHLYFKDHNLKRSDSWGKWMFEMYEIMHQYAY